MLDRKLLGTYLNDHLAGSTVGLELAKRARRSNEGSEYGEVLERIAGEIEEDRATLQKLMDAFEIKRDRPKVMGAWAAEKVGRLKPNGRLLSYSPLSRVVELEFLCLGVTGKLSLWKALLEVADTDDRLDAEELTALASRAQKQWMGLEEQRLRAAAEAFTAPD